MKAIRVSDRDEPKLGPIFWAWVMGESKHFRDGSDLRRFNLVQTFEKKTQLKDTQLMKGQSQQMNPRERGRRLGVRDEERMNSPLEKSDWGTQGSMRGKTHRAVKMWHPGRCQPGFEALSS